MRPATTIGRQGSSVAAVPSDGHGHAAIVGLIVGECHGVKHRRKIGLGFGMLHDLTNIIFVHPYLGWVAERTIPFAVPRDFAPIRRCSPLDLPQPDAQPQQRGAAAQSRSPLWPMRLTSWRTCLRTAASTASSRSTRYASSSQGGLTRGCGLRRPSSPASSWLSFPTSPCVACGAVCGLSR